MRLLGNQPQINQDKCLAWNVEQSPCEKACPAHVDVEGYITAIRKGHFHQAVAIMRDQLPFPATLGRVCHHPCEDACTLGRIGDPVAIRELKRFAMDYVMKDALDPEPVKVTRKEKIAVVGAGPAGLAAAYDLVRKGYGITVYEASPLAGGMLTAGIPDYILPKEIVEAEIDYIQKLGVTIRTDTRLGQDLSFDELSGKGFKAVLLATGIQKSIELTIPGSDLEGIYYALPFLRSIKTGQKDAVQGNVVIIGGGSVAMDAARALVRLGAEEVHLVCLESRNHIPAFPWELNAAEEEGVRIHASLAPQRIVTKPGEQGKTRLGIEFKSVASTGIDDNGRISWTLLEAEEGECSMEVDRVMVAIGQTPDPSLVDTLPLPFSQKGTFEVDPDTLLTPTPGMFAAGDAVTGPKTVIEAVASGKKAALAIDRYLKGETLKEDHPLIAPINYQDVLPFGMRMPDRQAGTVLPQHIRWRSFNEVNLGFSEKQAMAEANRCLRCKTCNRCMDEFGCVAVSWRQPQLKGKIAPHIDQDLCIGCGVCPQVCPYGSIEVI